MKSTLYVHEKALPSIKIRKGPQEAENYPLSVTVSLTTTTCFFIYIWIYGGEGDENNLFQIQLYLNYLFKDIILLACQTQQLKIKR